MKLLLAAMALALSLPAQVPTAATVAIQSKDGVSAVADFQDAVSVNLRPSHRTELAPLVVAIRYAENGGKGKEYGILHKRCPKTYRGQAGWCAATVQKNYDRWVKAGKLGDFITFLSKRYCPVGADNDPNGLNQHWVKNVKHFAKKFH
jgi:hypothetical protein